MNLLDVVQERALTELPTDPAKCPYCGSTNVTVFGTTSTLVGFTGTVNPNHQWQECGCDGCKKLFTREVKGLDVWYTARRDSSGATIILRGVSSCFESYQYTCTKCSGPVLRTHKDMAGNPTQVLSTRVEDGVWVREYTTHYNCTQCGHGGEVDRE